MTTAAMSNIADVLADNTVAIVCGSGGVGKTTTAAAIAAQAARTSDRRVLVITVDPARRLADALGVGHIGNAVTSVSSEALTVEGVAPKGRLSVAMLDAKESWDELVKRHAPDEETRLRIVGNPLYRNITERFVQSHDYIAMERLYELHDSGDYDLIVIDTPPSTHAVDFLEAPDRMADFFDSKLLKFLVAPSRSRFMSLTSRPFLQIADRLLGERFLNDITNFFTSLESMRPGFIARAQTVSALLKADSTTFVVVSTLEPSPRYEALRFLGELDKRQLHTGAIVLNRTLPAALLGEGAMQAANALRRKGHGLGDSTDEIAPAAKVDRVTDQLVATFDDFSSLARQEQTQRDALQHRADVVVSVPWFGEELRDLRGLLSVGEKLWA